MICTENIELESEHDINSRFDLSNSNASVCAGNFLLSLFHFNSQSGDERIRCTFSILALRWDAKRYCISISVHLVCTTHGLCIAASYISLSSDHFQKHKEINFSCVGITLLIVHLVNLSFLVSMMQLVT